MASERIQGFRLGVYVFKDAEIVDFAAPYGVFSVARRFDPELEAFLIADAMHTVQTQAGFTVLPNYSFLDGPAMDAFLIPGGFGTRQEMHNRRLHEFIRALPEACLLTSVCTGSWIYGRMGLLNGLAATSRKEPDRAEASPPGMVPLDRLGKIAPRPRCRPGELGPTGPAPRRSDKRQRPLCTPSRAPPRRRTPPRTPRGAEGGIPSPSRPLFLPR